MPSSFSTPSRFALAALLLAGLATASGCGWFRKGDRLYAQDPESRPLEVPPDLDRPRTDAAMALPGGSVTASGQTAPAAPAPASGTTGFNVPASRDEVFAQVGEALEGIDGVTIASRAQLLGAYDVNYEGSNFLVRVSEAEGGTSVAAVDPRGLPVSGEAPVKLMAALRAALIGN